MALLRPPHLPPRGPSPPRAPRGAAGDVAQDKDPHRWCVVKRVEQRVCSKESVVKRDVAKTQNPHRRCGQILKQIISV
jgi:hypothetical protein